MLKSHAVGIDLGTTYSCIARLNEHGEPVTIANQEGELSTPSVVFFDGDDVVVGTEALRNSIVRPDRVIQNAKRYVGTAKTWLIDGKVHTPTDVQSHIVKKLLDAATEQIGSIERAVITVPAQFSERQRQETIAAGKAAGLKHVDIINEPVAAALCYVLGTEGLWFTELAEEQRILVYDLGGGTFDLSMVRYEKNQVSVIASGGDLKLGGIDWNGVLENAIAGQFAADFGTDPRDDLEARQFLSMEVENTKRSLSVRPKAALTCQAGTHRKSYQVLQDQFEQLTKHLTERTAEITQAMLKNNKMGWAHVDVILTTGGASRMPMIRTMLKRIGGRTLNTSLSPDQSIAHGATYYAGMLLTNGDYARSILNQEAEARLSQIRQTSVNARALGILVRNPETDEREPHYLIEPNTPLPVTAKHVFGTVIPNQRRVNLRIVESGTAANKSNIELGTCVIDGLPENLPIDSEIEVAISYDAEARVNVSAIELTSGKAANAEIERKENLLTDSDSKTNFADSETVGTTAPPPPAAQRPPTPRTPTAPSVPKPAAVPSSLHKADRNRQLEESDRPIPLCNRCGEPLDSSQTCPDCGTSAGRRQKRSATGKKQQSGKSSTTSTRRNATARTKRPKLPRPARSASHSDEEILAFLDEGEERPVAKSQRKQGTKSKRPQKKSPPTKKPDLSGEDEFWELDF